MCVRCLSLCQHYIPTYDWFWFVDIYFILGWPVSYQWVKMHSIFWMRVKKTKRNEKPTYLWGKKIIIERLDCPSPNPSPNAFLHHSYFCTVTFLAGCMGWISEWLTVLIQFAVIKGVLLKWEMNCRLRRSSPCRASPSLSIPGSVWKMMWLFADDTICSNGCVCGFQRACCLSRSHI